MLLIDRQYIRYFDWVSFFITMGLSIIGLLFIFSATYRPALPFSIFFKKQAFGVIAGFFIYCFFCFADYRTLYRWGYFAYFAVLGLLVFTLIKGSVGMGGQRWINMGLFKFQPSELTKLLFPAFIGFYNSSQKNFPLLSFKNFIPILITIGISFFLVVKQPDLGTALVILFSSLLIAWTAGLSRKFFLLSTALLLITTPLSWHLLKPYQKKRISVFLGQGDAQKERYQIEQSKIAIGSGGMYGKGYLKGTQNQFMFLPENRTDFIFSVIAEEYGFLGTFLLILIFFTLFVRLIYVVTTIKNNSAQLLAMGLISHIIISTIINISMVTGLLPVVGIPLPLISYGLSHLWITFASLGWFNGIAMRRFYMTSTR